MVLNYVSFMKWNVKNLEKHARRFSTQKEIVEGVFVFHRHGDRTPGKSLVADSYHEEESSMWRTKLPPRSYYEKLSEKFPPRMYPGIDCSQFIGADEESEPYGFLTYKGMRQMYDVGTAISRHYNPNGDQAFQKHWNIKAFSTKYLRTVKSCQCFLDGLLSSGHRRTSYHESASPNWNTSGISEVEIFVRDMKYETLNAFDSSPDLVKKLVKNVIQTPEFIATDTKAAPMAARLSNYVPGLMKHAPYGSTSPSGINWIHAADHFVCRSSHSIPLSRFSDLEHESGAEETLQAMSYATISHLCARFRNWYSSPPILAEMAGPALNEIKEEMDEIINSSPKLEMKKTFNIYSCHDVTVLALLYALDLSPKELHMSFDNGLTGAKEGEWVTKWPKYASHLIFELVRVETKCDVEDELIVKVRFSEDKECVMPLSNFNRLISRLMDARE